MAKTTVTLRSSIPERIARAEQRAAAAVSKTVFDIAAGAEERAPVDTGHLKSTVEGVLDGPYSGEARVGAEYGLPVENGSTHHRGNSTWTIPPQPFFTPAVEDARGPFEAAVAQLYT